MKRIILQTLVPAVVVLVALVAAMALAQEQQEQQQKPKKIAEEEDDPAFRSGISVSATQVRLDVTVRDKDGNLFTGLKKEHFTVYEDKVKQDITNFLTVEAPITAVLLVEYTNHWFGGMRWTDTFLYEAWLASLSFVEQLRQDDWLALVAFDIKPTILTDFTQDRMEIHRAVNRLNIPGFSEINLFDALTDTLDRLQEVEGRTAVIVVATGIDTFSKTNLSKTLKRVKQANSPIYAVSLGGGLRARADHRFSTNLRMDFLQADNTLRSFAKFTGGEAFFPRFTAQYRNIFHAISTLLRNQYSLSYIPSNTKKDGKFRKIRVEVDLDGDGKRDKKLKVNHRSGYLADKG